MADIKWIKICTDIFDDEKMLLIETLPDADSIIVIWFKLLAFAGKTNNSGVFMMNNRVAYTEDMLSTIFRRKKSTVNLAFRTFQEFGMVEIINNVLTIPNWSKHQNFDKIEKNNEYMREYMREYREKQKQIACKVNSKVNSKVNVSALEENRIEENRNTLSSKLDCTYIINYLNKKTNKNFKANTKATKEHINARAKEGFSEDDFIKVIDIKVKKWADDPKMKDFLRPQTLFSTKFESYLNECETGVAENNDRDSNYYYPPTDKRPVPRANDVEWDNHFSDFC